MVDLDSEFVERLQPAVFDFIDSVGSLIETDEFIVPTKDLVTYHEEVAGGLHIEVPRPSEALRFILHQEDDDDMTIGNLNDVANWLVESKNGFPISYLQERERTDAEMKQVYENQLVDFAGQVMDYESGLRYPDERYIHPSEIDQFAGLDPTNEAFDLAFENELAPKYSDTLDLNFIIPLNSLGYLDTSLSLDPHIESYEKGAIEYKVDPDIKLSKLNTSEKGGLSTYFQQNAGRAGGVDTPPTSGLNYRISVCLEVNDRSQAITHSDNTSMPALRFAGEIADKVVTALRLYHPDESVFAGTVYRLEKNWHSETMGISNITTTRTQGPRATSGPWGWYRLKGRENEYFSEFWDDYGDQLDTENGPVANPLRRFNQSYEKATFEDRFVDYFIGFESSLLQDTDASYKFRLPSRAILLLVDQTYYNGDYIFTLFDMLRKTRNKVIHNNAKVNDILGSDKSKEDVERLDFSDDFPPAREFNSRVRYFLAKVIIRYLHIHKKYGIDIHTINTEILEPAMIDSLKSPADLDAYFDKQI